MTKQIMSRIQIIKRKAPLPPSYGQNTYMTQYDIVCREVLYIHFH